MNIQVNGEAVRVSDGLSVPDLLRERQVRMPDMVSVELNGEILARGVFGATHLKEGDRVEFMYFMGGGSRAGWGAA